MGISFPQSIKILLCIAIAVACTQKSGAVAQVKHIKLKVIAEGFNQVTDLQAVPSMANIIAVMQKSGELYWLDVKSGKKGIWMVLKVPTNSEQGLLGIAFHPKFVTNGQFVVNYSVYSSGKSVSRVQLWSFAAGGQDLTKRKLAPLRIIMEVEQPYANHNAGQLAFGPDGYLYIGWGDGGSGGDPHGHGQNPKTFLGSMLRIDIDSHSRQRPYAIPSDNPFVKKQGFAAEVWAWGFRNPWRFSFDSKGRLWVADVGQHKWEEISLAQKGNNYGWNITEGDHCFKPANRCDKSKLTMPVHEYSHKDGKSITGGYEYTGEKIAWLKGKYIFGDFVKGRIWALDISSIDVDSNKPPELLDLGSHNIMISTFGRTLDGEILVTDFNGGKIYQIESIQKGINDS